MHPIPSLSPNANMPGRCVRSSPRFRQPHQGNNGGRCFRLFSASKPTFTLRRPFFCDYGYNVKLGTNVYFNFNCVVLDVATVSIGSNTIVGPAVQIYTATHPMNAAERRRGLESGKAVSIGEDVWIGGGAIICPGVTIGAGTIIGAGSVVIRNIPANVFAAGNPCRVIRAFP